MASEVLNTPGSLVHRFFPIHSGFCEVVETAGLLPVGGVGPSRSRFRFPTAAAAASRNKVLSLSSPSWWCSALVLAARREVSSLVLCYEHGEAASVCAEGRRVELQAWLFHGGVSRQ